MGRKGCRPGVALPRALGRLARTDRAGICRYRRLLVEAGPARKVREAKAELAGVAALPPITRDDALLRQKVAFGVEPPSAVVLPEHRQLDPFHLLAILARGRPMAQAVCRCVGGYVLRSVAELQRNGTSARPRRPNGSRR